MNHVIFSRGSNTSTIHKSYIPPIWFLENRVEKNWVDVMIHHMLNNKGKNMNLPYDEIITKVFVYSGFDLDEEESKVKHSKVGKTFWVK